MNWRWPEGTEILWRLCDFLWRLCFKVVFLPKRPLELEMTWASSVCSTESIKFGYRSKTFFCFFFPVLLSKKSLQFFDIFRGDSSKRKFFFPDTPCTHYTQILKSAMISGISWLLLLAIRNLVTCTLGCRSFPVKVPWELCGRWTSAVALKRPVFCRRQWICRD